MQAKLQNLWENVRSSLWFLPSILVVLALIVSSLLIEFDVRLAERQSKLIPWLFSGTADAARALLSTIAGSLISVISIAFSLTIIALQQAATQFSPRVLRTFTASRVNQLVLGAYTATFIYALLVLRTVRSADQGAPFVPALSVTIAVGLALLCLGLLIYFIHHTSQALQVSVIIDQIRMDLIEQLEALYPTQLAESSDDPLPTHEIVDALPPAPTCSIHAASTGFVRNVDEQALLALPLDYVEWLCVRPQVGQFVSRGSTLVVLIGVDSAPKHVDHVIQNAIVLDNERSLHQDPLFGIRQLVDIALKALSPGINDPTTAEYVLHHLGAALGGLATCQFPPNVQIAANGQTKILLNLPTWADYVEAAFNQIRREAQDDVQVTRTLLHVLAMLAERVPNDARALPLQQQVASIRRSIEEQEWSIDEQQQMTRLVDSLERTLRSHHSVAG